MEKLSIVIPVYNEDKFIEKTLVEICNCDSLNLKKEVIIVDDGSKDGTRY